MEKLEVKKANALIAWRKADEKGKGLLENLYGKEVFEKRNIMDRVKTFGDALEETGRPDVPDFSDLPEDLRLYFKNQYKMIVTAEALNEGWEPDWDNNNEPKFRSWFFMSPSGFSFGGSSCDFSVASAGCGSRLCFKNRELSDYAAKQFLDIWKKIQLK